MVVKQWIVMLGLWGATALNADADERERNLLRNGSFEYEGAMASAPGAYHWIMNDPDDRGDSWGSAARQDWRAKDGMFVATLRGTWAGAGDAGGWWQDSPARSGERYTFSGWFYADADWSAAEQFVKLEFRDETNTRILHETKRLLEGVRDDWREHHLEAVAPEGTAFVRVVVHVSGAGPSGALQFDEVKLVERSSDSP